MIPFVTGQVLRRDEMEYGATPLTVPIPTENGYLSGEFWRVPISTKQGRFLRYDYVDGAGAKPSSDSVRCFKFTDPSENNTYWIALQDGHTAKDFTDRVNITDATTLTPMPTVTIPLVISEVAGKLVSGNYTYQTIALALAAGAVYAPYASVNNNALAAAPGDGFATIGAFITWANSNWNGAGTWSNPSGNIIQLVSSTAKSAGIYIPQSRNFDSNNAGAATPTSGHHWHMVMVLNGVTLTQDGAVDGTLAALTTLLNTNYGSYGVFTAIASNKIRLVSDTVFTATLTITDVA